MNTFFNSFILTIKSIKKNLVIWIFPLLLMTILLVINENPTTILNYFLMNSNNPIYCLTLFLKVVGAVVGTTLVFTMIFVFAKRIFEESSKTFLEDIKKYCIPVFVLVVIRFLFLNLIRGCFVGLFRFNEFLWVFWNYLIINIENLFFYFVLFIMFVDDHSNEKKSFIARVKKNLSVTKAVQLLIIALIASLVQIPVMHYPKHKLFQPDPIHLVSLRLIFSSLIQTFLIVFTAVLCLVQKKHMSDN